MRFPIRRWRAMLALASLSLAGVTGCATGPLVSAQAHRYRIEVKLDPATHRLAGRTAIDLSLGETESALDDPRTVSVAFRLHPGLVVDEVATAGARLRHHRKLGPDQHVTTNPTPTRHIVTVDAPSQQFTLFVDYKGTVFQDPSAGERPGEIHNFDMTAHVGDDGIYLAGGYWYPQPVAPAGASTRPADFTLLAHPIDGMELVAGGVLDERLGEQSGMLAWQSPYPLTEMVLVGGHHDVHRTTHNNVAISAHLTPDQEPYAEGLLEAVTRNLDRYEPLIGAYPADDYAIVNNFFSSGFAFPTFTLLSSAVINMGERSQTAHGYIDHEMLHSWWGNGILVDPEDGNWCESLTSYATNYYGYILDGEPDEARRKRRNYCHFLSRMKPEDDRPLGNYGRPDSCSRGVAYNKGAAVFHMLARRIGQERFWAAMREFTASYIGRYASWEDIRTLCENHGDTSLETFFAQWIRSAGAPTLAIHEAEYDSGNQVLTLDVSQGDTAWTADVPVRIVHAAGNLDIDVHLTAVEQSVRLPVNIVPVSVELDPDYHVFRRVPLEDVVPTTAATRHGDKLTTLLPTGDVPEAYRTTQKIFEMSFEADERMTVSPVEENGDALAERCVLVLGDAARQPYVSAFLSAVEFPVTWTDDGFEVSGVVYDDPQDAVLCTSSHPGVPGGGITVIYANSEEAIPKPMNVPMYAHSLVIFNAKKPTVRLDLEKRNSVPVTMMP